MFYSFPTSMFNSYFLLQWSGYGCLHVFNFSEFTSSFVWIWLILKLHIKSSNTWLPWISHDYWMKFGKFTLFKYCLLHVNSPSQHENYKGNKILFYFGILWCFVGQLGFQNVHSGQSRRTYKPILELPLTSRNYSIFLMIFPIWFSFVYIFLVFWLSMSSTVTNPEEVPQVMLRPF